MIVFFICYLILVCILGILSFIKGLYDKDDLLLIISVVFIVISLILAFLYI